MPEKTREVKYSGAGMSTSTTVIVPEKWCTDKNDIQGDQERAIEYQQFHRVGDIKLGYLKFSEEVHKGKLFVLNGFGGA